MSALTVAADDLRRDDVIVADRGEFTVDRVIRDMEKRLVYTTGADGECGYFRVDADSTCTVRRQS